VRPKTGARGKPLNRRNGKGSSQKEKLPPDSTDGATDSVRDQPLLQRETFTTSRLLEFFSEKELTMQIGHPKDCWPVALLKELIDNGLDNSEQGGVPQIEVIVEDDSFAVRDNGTGIPVNTIQRSLDYSVRVSDKAHYASPTRGQLGNALKCVWAAPFVATGERGLVEVEACGQHHEIEVTLDRIAQEPKLKPTAQPISVKSGTFFRLHWPSVASCLRGAKSDDFYRDHTSDDDDEDVLRSRFYAARGLLAAYSTFNPHATFTLTGCGSPLTLSGSDPNWRKWLASYPTDPHWYNRERFRGLVAAHLMLEEQSGLRSKSLRDFLKEFAGLSSTRKRKAVLDDAELSHAQLCDLVRDGALDEEAIDGLLWAMTDHTKPVKSAKLGILGKDHLTDSLEQSYDVDPDSIRYKRVLGKEKAFVMEVAFGVKARPYRYGRDIVVGLNWSPALSMPFEELEALLSNTRINTYDPVVVLVHLASPCMDFTDRGKGHLDLSDETEEALARCIRYVGKRWKEAKRSADRAGRLSDQELERQQKAERRRNITIKQASYQVMEQAYLEASGNTGMANARQVMYKARPRVLELTDGRCWKRSSTFTQQYLPDYIEEHPDQTRSWDVVFDDRGHFVEPHTDRTIGLGTLSVRNYVANWKDDVTDVMSVPQVDHAFPTLGPANRYPFVLFLEKEGFNQQLEKAEIRNRYGVSIMSTKGMSVTAARSLVEALSKAGVKILVLHDFDKSGRSILHTLSHDTRRYTFKTRPNVIDLGLRVEDVRRMNLPSEPVQYKTKKDPRINLRASGATEEECNFLVHEKTPTGWSGERVELNAMGSDQFIQFLEQKLAEHGVAKLVPDKAILEKAYRRARRLVILQAAIHKAARDLPDDGQLPPPADLAEKVRRQVDGTTQSWDEALWNTVLKSIGPR
jgi:DNA topoisomerase VI subunit B